MDRSLDPELLRSALGGSRGLPSVEELSSLVARLEIAIFAGWAPEKSQELLSVAWYLHGIAASEDALDVYGPQRQKRAFQVSAHFFDLQIAAAGPDEPLRRRYLFACQIGYVRSGVTPNARAVFDREWHASSPQDLADVEEVALTLGCMTLAGLYPRVKRLAQNILGSARSIASNADLPGFLGTQFEAELYLCLGCLSLVRFLETGQSSDLLSARNHLRLAASSESGAGDIDSRWVAAHLFRVSTDFEGASVWTVLPDDLPPGVARAFVHGKPRVTMFWPPQLKGLNGLPTALTDPTVRRAVLALPTSAGKSLLAQVVVAVHLARGTTGACYVAPTRSLCREVRATLGARLRYITDSEGGRPRFDVVTPERLYAALCFDAAEVLGRYGLFVFDEVQSIGDGARGWILESALALLHAATENSEHRIVAISPTAGNLAQIATWTGASHEGQLVLKSDWRAPRRLNAVYEPTPRWGEAQDTPRRSKPWPIRRSVPMYGRVSLQLPNGGERGSLSFTAPVGRLRLKVSEDGRRHEREDVTAKYEMNLPMIAHLGQAGSVLVLVGTRPSCVRYARALAAKLGEDQRVPLSLISSIAGKLGNDHPLVRTLAAGVAYHHAALPSDVQSMIEDAVRSGQVAYLIATTTLTEGVNLPVRSVFIAETGFHDGTGYQRVVTGTRLLNAVGRAGRALAETEGWAVLADSPNCSVEEFCGANQGYADLTIDSQLTTRESLQSLEELEAHLSAGADLLLSAAGPAADFVSFNWFLMEASDRLNKEPYAVDSMHILESTLAWAQLPEEMRERWQAVAAASQEAYTNFEPGRRRRWVQSGLPLSTAAQLEELAHELASQRAASEEMLDPIPTRDMLESSGIMRRLMSLPAAPRVQVFNIRRGRGRSEIEIDLLGLLHDWMAGREFGRMAADHLSGVADSDYRDEQLADVVSRLFVDYLPWVLGVLLQWAWELVEDTEEPRTFGQLLRRMVREGTQIPVDVLELIERPSTYFTLPAMIRHGVDNEAALALVHAGVSSRSLAARIGAAFTAESEAEGGELRSWLCELGISEWGKRFDASALSLSELLRFAGSETSPLLGQVLNGNTHHIPLELLGVVELGAELRLEPVTAGEQTGRIGLIVDGEILACIPLEYQHDIQALLDLDLPLRLLVEAAQEETRLAVSLDRTELLGEDEAD